jgi:ATPase subunit of ABC transporter with duplicated ATPase domains
VGHSGCRCADLLDPELTVFDQVQRDLPHDDIGARRSLLGAFQFSGDDADKQIRALSAPSARAMRRRASTPDRRSMET